jgi:hypothetical protein
MGTGKLLPPGLTLAHPKVISTAPGAAVSWKSSSTIPIAGKTPGKSKGKRTGKENSGK